MEDKYYAPKIEEFHVGFEYEQHEIINKHDPHWKMMVKKMGFSNKEINQIFYNVDLVDNLDQKRIRVKYLDRSDIESFGFKFDATRSKVDGNFVGSYENEKYYLDYSPYNYSGEFNSSVHLRVMKIKDIPITSYQSNYQFIYDGIIKNKSELKKLLIQLEIINE